MKKEKKNYRVQKLLKWFHQFQGLNIKIESKNHSFSFELSNNMLPHLLGLQYIHKKLPNNSFPKTGSELYKEIEKEFFSDEEIVEMCRKNNPAFAKYTDRRIKSFKFMLEHLEKCTLVENSYKNPNSTLKSDYFIINEVNFNNEDRFLNLGVMKQDVGECFETFFDREDNKYYKNTSFREKGLALFVYDKEIDDYKPFTFKDKHNIDLSELKKNIIIKENVDNIVAWELKNFDEKQEKEFVDKVEKIINLQNELESKNKNRLNFDFIEKKIPFYDKINENLKIKNFFKKLEKVDVDILSNEDKKELMSEMKNVLETQVRLEYYEKNLYSKGETFKMINQFFGKIIDEKNVKKALNYLENNDFPINYINNFKKNYKNEIYNIDEEVKEQVKEINNQPTKESNELLDNLLTKI